MFVNFNILNQLGSPAINSNTFANRPAAGQTGRLFVSTDTYEIYRDNGTTWDLIGGPGSSTITGTGTATQVAYFTSSQAIGSSANLFWDNTSGFLGVATATPSARIEAVKTDGIGIYANFTTNAGSGSGTTGIYSINNTASSGYAAVIEERTGNTTGGQYPLLVKHSLSSGTAGVGMGTGLQFQLPDDAGTFKTTQLTIETINAAAATYATRYRFNVQSNGSSTPVAYINATGVGIFTATPGAALDVHSTGTIAQFNTTSGTGNTYIAFQRTGTGLWRIGDTYNAGNNFFELHNTVLAVDALEFEAATNKSTFQAQQTYTTGLARGNYFDYNLSVAAGGSFSSPNAITALTATLDLTLAGNATIPSGARSGLDAYNTIAFTGAGTLTHTQGTQIRAYSNVTAGWAFNGSATGTITHLAGLRALFPDNSGSAVNVTNNYALLLNDQTANTGTVTYTNRWGVYQEGASDLNYFAANTLIGTTVNTGQKLQVNGNVAIQNTNLYLLRSDVTGEYALQSRDLDFRLIGSSDAITQRKISFGFYTANNVAGTWNERVFINSYTGNASFNGSVGIGTSTLTRKLTVAGTAIANDQLLYLKQGDDNGYSFNIDSASTGNFFIRGVNFGVETADIITLTRNTNVVGIGTSTNLNQKLVVRGTISGSPGDYTVNGVINGNRIFTGEGTNRGLAGITGIGTDSSFAVKTDPLGRQFGNVGLVGAANETGGGGRNVYGVYGYAIQTLASANNPSNVPVGGLFIAQLGATTGSTAAFTGTVYGVYGSASSSSATASNGSIIGVYGEATGKTGDTVYGGFFDAGGGTTNWGLYVNTGKAYLTGNVLIGTTTDAGQKLQVNGNGYFANTQINLTLNATSATQYARLVYQDNGVETGVVQYINNNFATSYRRNKLEIANGNGIHFIVSGDFSNADLVLTTSGNAEFKGPIKTGAPTTGTAAAWKLGSRVAATVVVNTTEYIEVDIGGTLYKLATVT